VAEWPPTRPLTETTDIGGKADKKRDGKKARKAREAAARAAAEAVPGVPERAFEGEAVDAEPVHEGAGTTTVAPLPPPGLAARGLDALADPAGLCYGEPIREAGRTLVPVSRVRVDGGGSIEAVPVGVLDVGPAGSHFALMHRGRDGVVPALVAALAGAAAGAAAGALGLRRRPVLRRRSWR
jgi:hypothetical protein